jgi:hypothetical protein
MSSGTVASLVLGANTPTIRGTGAALVGSEPLISGRAYRQA